jgi:mannitol/fructose-specific phosphotransferase system IIA component (Ntr-type)
VTANGPGDLRFSSLLGREGCFVLEGPPQPGCKDKWEAIATVLDLLVASGRVPAARRDAIHAALVAREKSLSTGLEGGIALPHAAVDGITDLQTALVVMRQPLPYQSIDGCPVRILVMLLIPRERRFAYLRVLSDAARLLSRQDVREKLLQAALGGPPRPSAAAMPELHDVLVAAESPAGAPGT